jgi:hypothetical protein
MASSITGSKESLAGVVDVVCEAFRQIEESGSGLEVEVFATALIYLQEHPEVSIYQALKVGLNDWDV